MAHSQAASRMPQTVFNEALRPISGEFSQFGKYTNRFRLALHEIFAGVRWRRHRLCTQFSPPVFSSPLALRPIVDSSAEVASMRTGILFLSSALSALSFVTVTPSPSEACCLCGWGWGGGGGYRYAPSAYAPAPYGPAYAPQPGPYPPSARPMPMVPPAAATNISAKDDSFDPKSLNIKPGTTIQWVNNGKHVHTITSDNGKFDSGDIQPGGVFRAQFVTPGTYHYHCKHHKGMSGTIVVEQK
jgi:plastocyanin